MLRARGGWTLPAAPAGINRTLYFFAGRSLRVGERWFDGLAAVKVRSDVEISIENGPETTELLLLQGRPINEPVAQHGPFVMNTRSEIQQAFADYQRTGFGGWPWPSNGPVHPKESERFAKHSDGRLERGE